MNPLALRSMSVLAIGVLAFGEANAQARSSISRAAGGPDQKATATDTGAQSRKRAELEGWLRRLPGTYQLKGTVLEYLNGGSLTSRDIRGETHCAGIGDGPGVHCLFKASFANQLYLTSQGRGGGTPTHSITFNTLNPAVMLFALDPDDLKIKVLLVDDHSIADVLTGSLAGNTVTLASEHKGCWGPAPLVHCPWALQFTAKPDSNEIRVKTTWNLRAIQIEFLLHRDPTAAHAGAPNSTPHPVSQ